MKTETVN